MDPQLLFWALIIYLILYFISSFYYKARAKIDADISAEFEKSQNLKAILYVYDSAVRTAKEQFIERGEEEHKASVRTTYDMQKRKDHSDNRTEKINGSKGKVITSPYKEIYIFQVACDQARRKALKRFQENAKPVATSANPVKKRSEKYTMQSRTT